MKNIILSVVLSLATGLGAVTSCGTLTDRAKDIVEERCQEDMPCWDCETMGNKICGPVKE